MFETIVVGTDGSSTARQAVAAAAELARLSSGHVHLVSAFAVPSGGGLAPELAGMSVASEGKLRAAAEDLVGRLAKELATDGVAATTHVCGDRPAQAIVEVAEAVGADLIVVGNRGMSGARRILGSVPNSVSHHASCSVLIVSTEE